VSITLHLSHSAEKQMPICHSNNRQFKPRSWYKSMQVT